MSEGRKAGVRLVPDPSRDRLSSRQLTDYRAHRRRLIEWILTRGKDPDRGDGYAQTTADERAYRLDRFYRWVWDQEARYTTAITHEHADGWLRQRATGDTSQADKAAHLKSLKMLFRWRATVFGDEEWEPEMTFSTTTGSTNPKDFLTRDEREAVRDAALEYGSVPSYDGLSPSEREERADRGSIGKRAQRLGFDLRIRISSTLRSVAPTALRRSAADSAAADVRAPEPSRTVSRLATRRNDGRHQRAGLAASSGRLPRAQNV